MKKALLFFLAFLSCAVAEEFVISFGEGGFKAYRVIDNTCFSFVLKGKDEKDLPKALSGAVAKALTDIRKMYKQKAEGFINIRVQFTEVNDALLYQICGDLVRRK